MRTVQPRLYIVDDKGNATVTTPAGKTAVIPGADLTKTDKDVTKPHAGNDIVTDKTVVSDPNALTPEEKKVIEDKVKAVNPGSTVVVDDKGKTAVIPGAQSQPQQVRQQSQVSQVQTMIEDKVKAVNPGSTVVVDDKGNATVTTSQ
ncbi:hypothetical protein [Streptococcus sp. Marseille-Q7156]